MSVAAVLVVAARLVLLHAPDGADVVINPDEVVSMRSPRAEPTAEKDKLFSENVRCMINTTDGKYITVRESCADVMRLFVDKEREP
jgi:hypothetical protein